MGGDGSCSSSRCPLSMRVLLGAAAIVGLMWLLVVASVGTTRTLRVDDAALNFKHGKVIGGGGGGGGRGGEEFLYNPELEHNYMMSKRRVPNGPDPIHNRRAGNSKRPPGRA